MDNFLQAIPNSPVVTFTILILVCLTIPPIFERLKLPGLVGLLVAGVVLGKNGFQLLDSDSETMKLFADIGKIYLMFVAGLEIDLEEFRRTKNRSLCFGIATFAIPLTTGTSIGLMFGFGLNASILIGSLLASHTLLGYPIVNRLGVVRNEAVTVSIGATIITDVSALLVLAICISIHGGEFSALSLIIQLIALALYSAIVLLGLDWAGKEYFRRTGDEQGNQFLFVLLAVFLASVGAQVINIDKIVGAFLTGLAVNDVLGHSPVEEKVEFLGSTLFIPFFFIDMGLLIDIPAFVTSLTTGLGLTLAIVLGLIGSKFLAAFSAKLLYKYNWNETLTMWSLSLPQVAATLAAALVGVNAGLLSQELFNSVIVLMLVTSILGPILTARNARNLTIPKENLQPKSEDWVLGIEPVEPYSPPRTGSQLTGCKLKNKFTVLVPVYNPLSQRYLIEMSALFARHESGIVVPLSITQAHAHMDAPQLNLALEQSDRLLERCVEVAQEFQVEAKPKVRIDDDVAEGISRAAREQNANLIVMGWSASTASLRARLFGSLVDNVFWSSHCPVAMVKLLDEPVNIRSILVPVKNITPQAIRTVRFAQLFADANQGRIVLLHICDRRTSPEQITQFESEMAEVLAQGGPQVQARIKTVAYDDVAKVIIRAAKSFDLVVLRSMRRRTAGGLAVSDVTTEAIKKLNCSIVLFGEPHS
ncbi:cation:proton antiporter [Limnoraphis robusta Tam1]|uniref:Cation:proton antiporter n=1 Tax=Limnoraphis robusta CCNP1315 TaxID=3110306 RepID=A0ABU5U0A7_9CYAN|nr:cation:proton antiporter [Limnoraphis robusta]MEA5497692.1 cation:proton antiporter [Limnoraphis robusta BA-68 BA1]MEA5520519.1 cation:proton antiporter [Limnoraphis robusta CCNP1315]MEA5537634.1 cation:proton antiporter [Limnoraphis robusta Tam1]MEA5547032.1 cation:proton antiporter [Limnoraphis robusta CCNP1324]